MSTQKLWQKNQIALHPLIEQYTVGDDYILDKEIMIYDIQASIAHAKGLEKIGIINKNELEKLIATLNKLWKEFKEGNIIIKIQDEDCHTVIENYLIKNLGDVGKKIHTGRSRNDQVLVVLQLYMKDMLEKTKQKTIEVAETALQIAKKHQNIPLPGYSHTQQAMLSSLGHYFSNLVESLLDDAVFLQAVKQHLDKNPLGSAAGFGVSLPLDRELTTTELGFKEMQINSLYCQNSRGKYASIFLEAMAQLMLTMGKFANDLILFTSQEFDFFIVDSQLTTGSSIMPQKKNLDAMEILRGNMSVVIGNQDICKNICKNLISGYNRDLQLIKKPLMDSVKIVLDSLEVVKLYLEGIEPKPKQIEDKIKSEIFAADIANQLVKEDGLPFRDAYNQAMDKLSAKNIDIQKNLKSKISLGAPGNLNLRHYEHIIKKLQS